jgi:hypothetical protein
MARRTCCVGRWDSSVRLCRQLSLTSHRLNIELVISLLEISLVAEGLWPFYFGKYFPRGRIFWDHTCKQLFLGCKNKCDYTVNDEFQMTFCLSSRSQVYDWAFQIQIYVKIHSLMLWYYFICYTIYDGFIMWPRVSTSTVTAFFNFCCCFFF